MMSRRAISVIRDRGLRGAVEAALSAAGVIVEHRDDVPGDPGDARLVVADRATRQAAGAALRGLSVPVVVVGDDLDDDELMAMMLDAPVSHLVEDPGHRDLTITSEKLSSGDVFGLEKYLAAGSAIRERAIAGDREKRHAMAEVCAWAEASGARRPLVHRMASVVDELMMNALYDTPLTCDRRTVLRWGADDRALAISVADRCGALRQRDVIDHVRRARRAGGRPRGEGDPPARDPSVQREPRAEPEPRRGAGLGLYLVVANVASLVFNVEAGRRTEAVCLFDRAPTGRRAVSPVRSLHVFRAAAP